MRRLGVTIRQKIAEADDQWVQEAQKLVQGLGEDKERQLRNIQTIAETSNSWKALELFIRYQAARKELDNTWAEKAIQQLQGLKQHAEALAREAKADSKAVHMELVARVLGYAVRWHVWHVKKEEPRQ